MGATQYADWSIWAGPLVELQQINQAASEKVVRECISYYSDNAAAAVKCTQTMQRVTSPEDFFSTQMKLLSQQWDKNLEFLQNISQIYQEAIKEQAKWTEEKVSSAMKNTTKAVKKTAEE